VIEKNVSAMIAAMSFALHAPIRRTMESNAHATNERLTIHSQSITIATDHNPANTQKVNMTKGKMVPTHPSGLLRSHLNATKTPEIAASGMKTRKKYRKFGGMLHKESIDFLLTSQKYDSITAIPHPTNAIGAMSISRQSYILYNILFLCSKLSSVKKTKISNFSFCA